MGPCQSELVPNPQTQPWPGSGPAESGSTGHRRPRNWGRSPYVILCVSNQAHFDFLK